MTRQELVRKLKAAKIPRPASTKRQTQRVEVKAGGRAYLGRVWHVDESILVLRSPTNCIPIGREQIFIADITHFRAIKPPPWRKVGSK